MLLHYPPVCEKFALWNDALARSRTVRAQEGAKWAFEPAPGRSRCSLTCSSGRLHARAGCAGVPVDRHRGSPLCDKSLLGLPKPTNEQLCATWRTADLRDTKCKSIPFGGEYSCNTQSLLPPLSDGPTERLIC